MIDELNVDGSTLTKADMYTIIKQTEEQNVKLRKQYEAVISDYRSEVAKLRELVRSVLVLRHDPVYKWLDATTAEVCGKSFTEQARELGIEVDDA